MIEIQHLGKRYLSKDGDYTALKDINLTIADGEIFGIIGLSGAGKSTLVRCINGLEKFDEGRILYNGEEVTFDSTYRRKVTMIFQQFNLLQQRTVLKNVELAGEIVGDKDRMQKAKKWLDAVGLGDKLDAYPSQLSGGQQQRVAIARALMTDPEVILCDEATSALDPETTKSILELLRELNQKLGITVIIISHQMSVIEAICDKVAIIDHAEIIEQGSIDQVFLSPQTAVGKKLIYSGHITASGSSHLVKVMFEGEVELPVVTNIIQDCNILLSVLYAESKTLAGKSFGQIIFRLPYYEEDIGKLKAYFESKGIAYEEVNADELC